MTACAEEFGTALTGDADAAARLRQGAGPHGRDPQARRLAGLSAGSADRRRSRGGHHPVEARATRRAAPSQGRRDVVLLLGPCVLYLLAFSVFPLVYSLYVALCDYDQQSRATSRSSAWTTSASSSRATSSGRPPATRPIFTLGGVALQVRAGHGARAVLRPEAARRRDRARDPDPADAADADRRRPDVADAAEPGLGPVHVGRRQGRHRRPAVAVRSRHRAARAAARGHVAVDAVRVHRRLRPAAGPAARGVRGQRGGRRVVVAAHAAPDAAAARCRRSSSRRSSAASTPSAPSTWSTASRAAAPGQSTTTLSFEAFQNGFSFFRYGYASAVSYFMVVVAAIGLTVLLRFVRLRREETGVRVVGRVALLRRAGR